MSYTVELLPREPILLEVANPDFDLVADGERTEKETKDILDQMEQPIFVIFDAREVHVNFEQLQAASNMFLNQSKILKHPKMREYLLVSQMVGLSLITKGLDTATFGNFKLRVFGTREEALAYARKAAQS